MVFYMLQRKASCWLLASTFHSRGKFRKWSINRTPAADFVTRYPLLAFKLKWTKRCPDVWGFRIRWKWLRSVYSLYRHPLSSPGSVSAHFQRYYLFLPTTQFRFLYHYTTEITIELSYDESAATNQQEKFFEDIRDTCESCAIRIHLLIFSSRQA